MMFILFIIDLIVVLAALNSAFSYGKEGYK